MSAETDQMVNDHVERLGLREARLTDAGTQATVNILKQILKTVEAAMRDESIEPDVARRVLRLAIYGAMPNQIDIDEKKRLRELLIDLHGRATLPTFLNPDSGPTTSRSA